MPVGEKGTSEGDSGGSPGRRSRQKNGLTDRDMEKDEHWTDREDDRGKDQNRERDHEHHKESTVAARFEDKEITDLKMVCALSLNTFKLVAHCWISIAKV